MKAARRSAWNRHAAQGWYAKASTTATAVTGVGGPLVGLSWVPAVSVTVTRVEWALAQGPPGARVDDLAVEAIPPTGRTTGFRITA